MSEKKRNKNAALALTGAMQSKPKANTKRNTSAKQKKRLESQNLVQKNFTLPDGTADNLDLLQLRLRRLLDARRDVSYSSIVTELIDAAFDDFKQNGADSEIAKRLKRNIDSKK